MHSRLLSVLLAIIAVSICLLTTCAVAQAGTLDEIRQRGEVVVGTDATYPPFEWKVGDRFQGFDIDFGEALAKEMGIPRVRWVNAAFDGILAALISEKYDMVISITTI